MSDQYDDGEKSGYDKGWVDANSYLESELAELRKKLEVAIEALEHYATDLDGFCDAKGYGVAREALKAIE